MHAQPGISRDTDPDHTRWPEELAARYRAIGHWRGQSFGTLLTRLSAAHAGRTAVVGERPGGSARWTYHQLDERAHRTAAGLYQLGLRPGDRVVMQLTNVPDFLPVVFALFRLGAWPVFALPAHRDNELGHFARQSEASAIITVDRHERHDHAAMARRVAGATSTVRHILVLGEAPAGTVPLEEVGATPRELPDPDSESVAFLQVSGGSTGLPKLIPRSHDDYLYSVRESSRICRLRPQSVYLAALPVAHNFTLSSPGVLGALHAGATSVLATSPDPRDAFRLIEREHVTITSVVPPLASAWVLAAGRREYDLSSLQVLQVGGAKCGRELAGQIGPALGCAVQQVFGMAEGLVNYTRLDDPAEIVLGTQGRPISPDDEIRVVDPDDPEAPSDAEVPIGSVGALLTRGPYTIRGYYRAAAHNATTFTSDGFYRTGDLVRLLPTGHLEVIGRNKEQINRGGEKIAPEEVENHLMAHPAVLDAAVVPEPDPYLGERGCAYVLAAPGAAPPTAVQLRRHLRERGLAGYKVPDRVVVVDEFPVTAVGKTSKKALRAALGAIRSQPRC